MGQGLKSSGWRYDRYVAQVNRLQPRYDAAWKELVDTKVLRPFETEKFILSTESAFQRQSEEEAAWKAVKSAKSAAESVLSRTEKARNNPRPSSTTI